LVVYHLASRKVLSYHARFELLKSSKMEQTWEKWSRGEKITFGITGKYPSLSHSLHVT